MDDNNNSLEEAFHLLAGILVRSDPSRLEAWAGVGLTMTQLRVLFLVREHEGASARMLAESLNVTPSTLTRIMDRLVRNRLVQRRLDEGDRRLVRHHLTPSALDMVSELERTGRERMYRIFRHMAPDQLKRLISGLRDLAAAAEVAESAGQTEKVSAR